MQERVWKREHCYTVGGNVSWCSYYRVQYGGSLKIKIELPYYSAIPVQSYTWRKPNLKWYMLLSVHCSNIYNSQDVEATSMPTKRVMNKEDVNAYNGTLLRHKKERDNAICSNIDRLRDCHTD